MLDLTAKSDNQGDIADVIDLVGNALGIPIDQLYGPLGEN